MDDLVATVFRLDVALADFAFVVLLRVAPPPRELDDSVFLANLPPSSHFAATPGILRLIPGGSHEWTTRAPSSRPDYNPPVPVERLAPPRSLMDVLERVLEGGIVLEAPDRQSSIQPPIPTPVEEWRTGLAPTPISGPSNGGASGAPVAAAMDAEITPRTPPHTRPAETEFLVTH